MLNMFQPFLGIIPLSISLINFSSFYLISTFSHTNQTILMCQFLYENAARNRKMRHKKKHFPHSSIKAKLLHYSTHIIFHTFFVLPQMGKHSLAANPNQSLHFSLAL